MSNTVIELRDMTPAECQYWLNDQEGERVTETARFMGLGRDFVVCIGIENAPECIAVSIPTSGFLPFPMPKVIYMGTSQSDAAHAAHQAWETHMIANFGTGF